MKIPLPRTLGLLLITLSAFAQPAVAQLNMIFSNDPSVSGWQSDNIYVTILRGQKYSNPLTDVPFITYVNNTGTNPFTWTWATNIIANSTSIDGTNVFSGYTTNLGQGYSESISLSTIMANGGLQWVSNASSAQVIISYGAVINSTATTNQVANYYTTNGSGVISQNTTAFTNQLAFYWNGQLAPNNPSDPSYQTPYQNFELTYTGTNKGDQGDITAINYMGAFLSISSFQSANASGTPLQTVGFLQSNTAQAASALQTFTNVIGPNGYGNTTTASIVTNSAGNVVRLIGPSQFGGQSNGLGSYTNFAAYLGNVQTSTYSNTILSNYSGYNTVQGGPTPDNGNQTNIVVTFVLTNTVTGDSANGYGLTAIGTVTTIQTAYFNGAATGTTITNTFSGITFAVPATYTNSTNVYQTAAAQFIYGASSGTNNYFVQNAAYSNLAALLSGSDGGAAFVDGANSNSWVDVQSQIAGELSAAFAFGLAGSTNTNASGVAIGNMPSAQWWIASNGVLPFSGTQSNSSYYDIWASLIDNISSNRVYGYAYSDRFGGSNSPLINDLSLNGTNIGSWGITIGAPLVGADISVPEPSTYVLFILGAVALGIIGRRKKTS